MRAHQNIVLNLAPACCHDASPLSYLLKYQIFVKQLVGYIAILCGVHRLSDALSVSEEIPCCC